MPRPVEPREPTCCSDCCPLKAGTFALAMMELVLSMVLLTVVAFGIHHQTGLEEAITGKACQLCRHKANSNYRILRIFQKPVALFWHLSPTFNVHFTVEMTV